MTNTVDAALIPTLPPLSMPIEEAMRTQRALRRLKPDPVDDALCLPIELALKAPTGRNAQNWEFVLVKDRMVKARLAWSVYGLLGRRLTATDSKMQRQLNAVQWQVEHFEEIPVLVVACLRGLQPMGRYGPTTRRPVAAVVTSIVMAINRSSLLSPEEAPSITHLRGHRCRSSLSMGSPNRRGTPTNPRVGPAHELIIHRSQNATSRAAHTVTPCHIATPPIFQRPPARLVLVNVDVAVQVDPDGMPSVPHARYGRARPARQHLPIKRQQGHQTIQLRHVHDFVLIDIDVAGAEPSPSTASETPPQEKRSGCGCSPGRPAPSRVPAARVHSAGQSLADLIERVPPIAGVGPDLAGPAPQFNRLGPRRADEHVWPLDLVEGAIPWPRVRDLLRCAADAHGEGFALDAGDGVDAGHLEQIGDVLGVIDLIEEFLLIWIHVHARDEEIFRDDRHALLLSA